MNDEGLGDEEKERKAKGMGHWSMGKRADSREQRKEVENGGLGETCQGLNDLAESVKK